MRENLKDHRKYLNEIAERNIVNFDKAILTLSSGALAISIVFIDKIIGPNGVNYIPILVLAWFSFLAAIVLNLWSYLSGYEEITKEIEDIDKKKKTSNDSVLKNKTHKSNICVLVLFTVGTFALLIFSLINMKANYNDRLMWLHYSGQKSYRSLK